MIFYNFIVKTNNNDYVKGADGVHLLKVNDDYQIVLGESKMVSDITSGISQAFSSVSKFLSEDKAKFEVGLIQGQLIKEAYDDKTYKLLEKLGHDDFY